MSSLDQVVDEGYASRDDPPVPVDEPRWLANAREYVDDTVGRPLGKLGLFAADSRRRRTYLKENMSRVSGFSKVAALTGAGSQPYWSLSIIDEYTDAFEQHTGSWSDGVGESFDANDISKFHIQIVDPISASSTFLKGSGTLYALHQVGVPADHAAQGVGAALIGKGVQAGLRNYVLDAYDEHSPGPFNFLMSPSPWAWLGVGSALKAFSYVTGDHGSTWEEAPASTVANARYNAPLEDNQASINTYEVEQLYDS